MRIHITEITKQFLINDAFETVERGVLAVSNKLHLKTYVVVGKYNNDGKLELFPYMNEIDEEIDIKYNPKWEGFKLLHPK